MIAKKRYGLWGMSYAPKIPANQLGKSKSVWPMREYGLYLVCVTRESTVVWFETGACQKPPVGKLAIFEIGTFDLAATGPLSQPSTYSS